MSYILDAIKKSEQQRQRSKGPSLDAPLMAPYTHKSNTFLLYALIVASLLALGLLLSIFGPWQSNKPSQIEAANTAVQAPPAVSVVTPPPPALPSPVIASPTPTPTKQTQPITTQRPLPNLPKAEPKIKIATAPLRENVVSQEKTAETITKPEVSHVPAEPKVAVKDSSVPTAAEKPAPTEDAPMADHTNEIALQNRLLEMSELPPHIQQEIPEMSIAGFAFSSNPLERSVGINGRLLQEGDYLKQGLRLDRINSDGLIFSYKGYHFRQSL